MTAANTQRSHVLAPGHRNQPESKQLNSTFLFFGWAWRLRHVRHVSQLSMATLHIWRDHLVRGFRGSQFQRFQPLLRLPHWRGLWQYSALGWGCLAPYLTALSVKWKGTGSRAPVPVQRHDLKGLPLSLSSNFHGFPTAPCWGACL